MPTVETPELIRHQYDEAGLCTNPEEVIVPMPKGSKCILLLATASDGAGWCYGWEVAGAEKIGKSTQEITVASEPRKSREDALKASLLGAVSIFNRHKSGAKLVKALEDFHAGLNPAQQTAEHAAASPKLESAPVLGEFKRIPVSACAANPWNRKTVAPEDFAALVASIREDGLIEPIVVREIPIKDELPGVGEAVPPAPHYEIIAGEQRWKAHVEAGIALIDAKVCKGIDQGRAKVLTLIENLLRVNLNPVDEAEGYASLVAEGWTQELIASRVQRSRPRITNALRLLQLPEDVLVFVRNGKLTPGHGEALLRFIPEGATDEERAEKIPAWRQILHVMAREAVAQRTPANMMKQGVPFYHELHEAGYAMLIDYFNPWKITDKLKKHPAYFQHGADWVCLHPAHWDAECERRAIDKAKKEEAERKRIAEEAAAQAGKRKQIQLCDIPSDTYVRIEEEGSGLESLVPKDKRLLAKSEEGKCTVITDVELGKRLNSAWQRAVKTDRKRACEDLAEKVRKTVGKLKRVGPREMVWLFASLSIPEFRSVPLYIDPEACKRAGVKLPKLPDNVDELLALSKCDPLDLVRVMIEYRLDFALKELVENGPASTGARLLRWWLDTDTLWLLEETEEGKAELLEQIKSSGWYQRTLTGEPAKEGEE